MSQMHRSAAPCRIKRVSFCMYLPGAAVVALVAMHSALLPSPAHARDGMVATAAITNQLDPDKTQGSAGQAFTSNVFDQLINFNQTPSDGRGRHVPALARSWTIAPDGRSIEFVLRDDAYFHNGEKVTADDVKFSLERAVNPAIKNPYASSYFANIDGVDVLDPHKVRLRLKFAWPGTLDALASRGDILPKDYVTKVGDAEFAKKPVGSGPYEFVSMRPGDRVEFKAFKRYYGGASLFDKLIWRAVPDINTRTALLASGEADAITDIPPSLAGTIEANGGNVGFLEGGFQRFLFINTLHKGPLADHRVRMALNLAIDRKSVFKAVFAGHDVPLLNGPLSSYHLGGNAAPPYPYDREKAKKLLAEAGYGKGFSTELVYTPSRFADDTELLPALVSYWKKIGVKVTLKPVEYNQWLEMARKKAYPGMLSFSKGTGIVTDPTSAFNRHVMCGALYSSYCNKKVDELVKSAREVLDESKLKKIFGEAQRIVHNDAPAIFLYDLPAVMAWKKGLVWKSEYGTDYNGSWLMLQAADK